MLPLSAFREMHKFDYSRSLPQKQKQMNTFPVLESTNIPFGLSPTIIRSLPSGLREVCCKNSREKTCNYNSGNHPFGGYATNCGWHCS